jgi:transposase
MAKQDDLPKTNPSEIEALIERVKRSGLEPRDAQLVERLLRLLLSMAALLEHKNASIKRLKRLIFGPGSDTRSATAAKTEPTTCVPASGAPAESERSSGSGPASGQACADDPKPKRPGHGRKPSSAYTGAQVLRCRHPQFKVGDHCPDPYCRGHLYGVVPPALFIQLTGQPLVGATKYEQEVLRCSACQERFTAPLPEEVRPEKYDATCDVSLALAKYGAGLPHYRIARLQESYGVPLPESVQFERCEAVADAALPVFLYLRRLAADGRVIYSDDTRVKILSCLKEDKQLKKEQRRATNTSGLVIEVGGQRIALYANGRQHAGENLEDLLKGRSAGLERPIQMADALSVNWSGAQQTVGAKCLAHARRKFIEIESSYPVECGVVLEAIAEVYRVEAQAEGMSAEERLRHHQTKSGLVMSELKEWIKKQFAERLVEPNSGLGQALRYVLKHWEGLTRFLSVADCPLDNNAAERALKRAVLLRKNALFYKNEHGASVGALLMSLIETCRLNGVSAWAYLLWVMRHRAEARAHPEVCLPWNYARSDSEQEAVALAA